MRSPHWSPTDYVHQSQWHERAHSTAQRQPGRRTILIVDDDRDTRDTLAVLLSQSGHHIWTARNGHEALELARSVNPDLIFLDICMPGADGYTVCRQVRQLAAGPAIKIYALSAVSRADHERRCAEAGFTARLQKPLEPAALSRFI
jgi:CheY-like chemotaxis protein